MEAATGPEGAPVQYHCRRGRAFDPLNRLVVQVVRNGSNQVAGVGVLRVEVNSCGGPALEHLACVEDPQLVANISQECQVVADVQRGHALATDQVNDQFVDTRLDGDVEPGGGFVQDHHLWPGASAIAIAIRCC